jgi:hypothetical protein
MPTPKYFKIKGILSGQRGATSEFGHKPGAEKTHKTHRRDKAKRKEKARRATSPGIFSHFRRIKILQSQEFI